MRLSSKLLRLSLFAGLATGAFVACGGDDTNDAPSETPGVFTPSTAGTTGAGGGGAAGASAGAGGLGGAGGAAGASVGAGTVGAPCSPTALCRPGLTCGSASTCELGGSTPEGKSCMATGECASGLFCGAHKVCVGVTGPTSKVCNDDAGCDAGQTCLPANACLPAGSAKEGDRCSLDGDCEAGLRCSYEGFVAYCRKGGDADIGASCASQADCLSGLGCAGGKCAPAIGGVPPGALSLWQGVKCEPASMGEQPTAYFRVPRGDETDQDFYQLPFPNDVRVKNGKIDLSGHPTPGAGLVGFDPVALYKEAIETSQEGFGPFQTVYFRFGENIDIDSFKGEGVVNFVDLTSGDSYGQKLGYSWYLSFRENKYSCPVWFAIRPPAGYPLRPGHSYAVYFTSGAKAGDGKEILVADDFKAVIGDATPSSDVLAAAHSKYAPLREYLAKMGVATSTVLNAAVFTVGPAHAPAERLARAVQAMSPPSASGWVKCGSGQPSPCSDATGDRACGAPDADYDELHALVTLPIFQQGEAPYATTGGDVAFSGDKATSTGTQQVCLALTVPTGTMPAEGWPLAIYAHGTGGSFRSHVNEGVAKALANVSLPDGAVKIAVLGIDQVQHGPRRGQSTEPPDLLFFNFKNPRAALGNPLQGAADQMSLARFAAQLSLPAAMSPTGADIKVDPKNVLFWGHSQGATEGGIGLAYIPEIKGAVLSGAAGSLIDALLTKNKPVDIAGALPFVLQDVELSTDAPPKLVVGGGIYHHVLSLLQGYIDPADPLNHAERITWAPPKDTMGAPIFQPGKHLFQPYGQNDSFTPGVTQLNFLIAAGLTEVNPDASVSKRDEIGPAPTMGMVSGNYAGVYTLGTKQYAPADYDGHFVVFKNAAAKADAVRFMGQMAKGAMPQVGQLATRPFLAVSRRSGGRRDFF